MSDEQTRFLQELAEDLNSRNIQLPSFPDVVINIRTALEDPSCTAERLASVVRTDPVLVARLLMAANSAFHNRAGIEITDLDLAISRLGFEVVRNTAITLAVEQIFEATEHKELRDGVQKIWQTSLALASMCFVIARNSGSINSDNAFLCGLLHEIGKLYILTKAADYPQLMGDDASLDTVMQQWSASVGKSIVDAWGFPSEIADSVDIEENLNLEGRASASLVDVVFLATQVLDDAAHLEEDDGCKVSAGRLNVSADNYPALQESYELHAQSLRSSIGG
ncbi:MAG: HDOD domain-containing protein [Woeseiaceae bacterium]|nr:HDOD domain-containing protein [Woeseiaceae bacterium]